MDERRGRVRVEEGTKRVRVVFGGEVVADTVRPLLVWERPQYPTYYLPADDVRDGVLVPTGDTHESPSRGTARVFSVKAGGREAADAARIYTDSPLEPLRDAVRFSWRAMDAWFEEDEQVHVHPRDPYKRIDILPSSRHVRIEVDGVTVADSPRPTMLFETGLPRRSYLPKTEVRLDLLEPSDHQTRCPYKGTASHYHVRIGDRLHENLAWSYPFTTRESQPIAGLVAFYDERVDVYVDGRFQERPRTHFG